MHSIQGKFLDRYEAGQLLAEHLGLGTHHGTITAASDWGAPAERKRIRPVLTQSYEAVFHATGLHIPRLQRAIGVIYRPETERESHYFYADSSTRSEQGL